MRKLEEVQEAARRAAALIRVLTVIGNHDGPVDNGDSAVKNATEWFNEMQGTNTSSMESGLLRLTQDIEDGRPTGWFDLYVNVAAGPDDE